MVDAKVGSAGCPKDSKVDPVLVLHRPTKIVEDPLAELADERVRLKIGISPRPAITRLGVRFSVAGDDSFTPEKGDAGKGAGSEVVGIVVETPTVRTCVNAGKVNGAEDVTWGLLLANNGGCWELSCVGGDASGG